MQDMHEQDKQAIRSLSSQKSARVPCIFIEHCLTCDECADFDNCFFSDPSVDWNASLLTEPGTNTVTFNSTSHRKIRLYRSVNSGIGGNGHGTHTQGTLLGSPLNQSDTYDLDYR